MPSWKSVETNRWMFRTCASSGAGSMVSPCSMSGSRDLGRDVDHGGCRHAARVPSLDLPGGLARLLVEQDVSDARPGKTGDGRRGDAHEQTGKGRVADLVLHLRVEGQRRQHVVHVLARQIVDGRPGGRRQPDRLRGRHGGDLQALGEDAVLLDRSLEPGQQQESGLGGGRLDADGRGGPQVGVDQDALPIERQREQRIAAGILDLDVGLGQADGGQGAHRHHPEQVSQLVVRGVPAREVVDGDAGQDLVGRARLRIGRGRLASGEAECKQVPGLHPVHDLLAPARRRERDPKPVADRHANAAAAGRDRDAADLEGGHDLDEIRRREVEASVGLDDAAVVLRLRPIADRDPPPQQVRRVHRRVEEDAVCVLAHDAHALAQVLVDLVADARDRDDLVGQRARQQAKPLRAERALVQHLRVGGAWEVRREQSRHAPAHELERGRGLGGAEVGVERLARIESERHHVAADRPHHGLEGGVEGQPYAALIVDDGAAVVGVRHQRLHEHAMEAHGGGTGRTRDGLMGNAGAREHAQRLRDVSRPGNGHQHRRRHLDQRAHVARGDALRPQHLDQHAGGVGVVAAPLAEGLEGALHSTVVELRPDGVAHPLVDLDRAGERVGGIAEHSRYRADRRLETLGSVREAGSRGRERRRRDARRTDARSRARRGRRRRRFDTRMDLPGLREDRGGPRARGGSGLAQQREEAALARLVGSPGQLDATRSVTRAGDGGRPREPCTVRGIRLLEPRDVRAE